MKVIFWDIDGVLNTPETWGAWTLNGDAASIDKDKAIMASELVASTGAKCVLSSTWRFAKGFDETIKALETQGWENAKNDFIGMTPVLFKKRGDEIQAWLSEYGVMDYVIVDDDTDAMSQHGRRYVGCNPEHGLTLKETQKVKDAFQYA